MAIALHLVHPILAGLLLAAVISAILSTVSSQLLVAASAVSYDIVEETLGRSSDDRRSLVLGRWTVAAVGLIGILVALSEVRLVFWFVLFAWSGLGAAFAPLILLALTRNGVNRHGALAAMLTGAGVTVVWKLGRDASANPESFARVWWTVVLCAVAILVLRWLTRTFDRGERVAVIAAASLAVISWWLVQRWGLHNLYELVPAFSLAGIAALAVSAITQSSNDGDGEIEGVES